MVSMSQKGAIYLIIGLMFLGAGIGVTVGTYEAARNSGGIYTVWIGAFVVGFVFVLYGIILCCMGQNRTIGPA